MAGFAVNVDVLMKNRYVWMGRMEGGQVVRDGFLESEFLSQFVTRKDLKEVMLWCGGGVGVWEGVWYAGVCVGVQEGCGYVGGGVGVWEGVWVCGRGCKSVTCVALLSD